MPSSVFTFTKTDFDIQVKDNNKVTTSFDSKTGVVTVSCYLRNPRRINAKYKLFHTVAGGSEVEVATYPETAPSTFNTGGAWQQLLIKWEAFKDLSLKNHGTTAIRLALWDNTSQLNNANRVVNDTQNIELNLEPKVIKCVEPKDFGEGGASDFIFEIPYLRRSQKVVPILKVSTSSDMSNPTTYTKCAFSKTSTNQVTGFQFAGGGLTSVFYNKLTGEDMGVGDIVSITDSVNYNGTYAVQSVDLSGGDGYEAEIQITHPEVQNTDAETGKLITSDPNTYYSPTELGRTIPSTQEIRFKIKMLNDSDGQISISANTYFTIDLNCQEPS